MDIELKDAKLTPRDLVKMLELIDDGTISGKIGKELLKEMLISGKSPDEIINQKKMRRISDSEYLNQLTEEIFSSNPQAVKDAIKDPKAVRFLVGQLMKKTGGKADPQLANGIVKEKLKTSKT